MQISPVTRNDTGHLKCIARLAIMQSVPIPLTERAALLESIALDIERSIDCADVIYLKAGAEAPVGYVLIEERWNLKHLFIAPEHQGRNIGRSLLVAAMDMCRKNSPGEFIRVNSSLNAVGFYERLGFVVYEPQRPVPSFVVPMIFRF